MADIKNPNVADRSNGVMFVAPIGVGAVLPAPVIASNLPTAETSVDGELYTNAGVVTQGDGTP